MFGLIRQLFQQYWGTPTYNLCILGPQNVGKTVLFNAIKYIDSDVQVPRSKYKETVGLNVTIYSNKGDKFKIWDLGGRPNLRKIWQNYYPECHGLIFLVNSRVQQCIEILSILSHKEMAKIPIIILITANSKEKVEAKINTPNFQLLVADRKYVIHQILVQQIGRSQLVLRDILHWLYSRIRELNKSIEE